MNAEFRTCLQSRRHLSKYNINKLSSKLIWLLRRKFLDLNTKTTWFWDMKTTSFWLGFCRTKAKLKGDKDFAI